MNAVPSENRAGRSEAAESSRSNGGMVSGSIISAPMASQIHVNILFMREAQELFDGFFPTNSRLLHAAKGRTDEMFRDFIDPYETRFDRLGRYGDPNDGA